MSREAVADPRPVPKTGEAAHAATRRRSVAAIVAFARAQPTGAVCLVLILLFVLAAIAAPLAAPYDPLQQHRADLLASPGARYPLGTDALGRDVLSRILYGARTSLLIGVATILLSVVIGTFFGILSGLLGRGVDIVVQRVMDAVHAIPPIVLLLFISATLGPSLPNVIIALVVVITPGFNRLARGETLRIREETYVEAARATGAGLLRIMGRHVLPNLLASMFTLATVSFAGVIIAESALSFLGLGAPPPTPSWGGMLSDGLQYVTEAPWLVLVPAIVLSLAVFAFNLVGDALRDHLDPRMKR
ncbi:peptide ABC transporter permease [Actinomadura sp. NBRC 104412]|uniref:ABC transporter permease n=1 Tax=Actinomadura sp. NBRC 104412 TaxID=3032203 RepID=UPI0024A196A0|nr:ABC transporter permease [Actinomadura sp. NBRC 104412]GLZ06229.1 peptide ABC transporter permease [Actinomadura sp. NBRC 104412]